MPMLEQAERKIYVVVISMFLATSHLTLVSDLLVKVNLNN